VQYSRSVSGDFIANLWANFPNAIELEWDLGDGAKSKESILKHVYKNPGKYTVKLVVTDICGERTFNKNIIFKPLMEPKPVPTVKPKTKTAVKKRI
jgi:PKD repeat protein